MTQQNLSQVRQVSQQAIPDFFQRRNVVGVGIGYKNSQGQATEQLGLIISVTQKLPAEQLAEQDLIPKSFGGLVTDVVETGRIRAYPENPRLRYRPAQPGISIGHHDITAGTLGLVVARNGQHFVLSNNHVLANCNEGKLGDAIYQPGPADGGTAADHFATLEAFEPLDFGQQPGECSIAGALTAFLNFLAKVTGSSHRLEPIKLTPGDNVMDAALARPADPALLALPILEIGQPVGAIEPALGMKVQKMGRTTGLTEGVITQIDATVSVEYGGRSARFTDQVFTTRMSSPGDSGSGILDMERHAVGLLFAGSEQVTIFTPIQRVLDHFGVTLA
ncbi:MAG: hypothetical protein JXA21_29490 [Anaerolineae bacterium]|nr:hypothetical protein [Anaerolineae bacterium]